MKAMTVCLLAVLLSVGCGMGVDEAEAAVSSSSQALRGPEGMPGPQGPGTPGDFGSVRPPPGTNRLPQDPVPTSLPGTPNVSPRPIGPIPTK